MVCARPRSGRRRFEETIAGFGNPPRRIMCRWLSYSCSDEVQTKATESLNDSLVTPAHTRVRARRLLSCDTRAQQKSEWPLHTQCALIRNLPTLCHLTRATAIRRLNTILCSLLIFSVCIKHFLNYDIQLGKWRRAHCHDSCGRSWMLWSAFD